MGYSEIKRHYDERVAKLSGELETLTDEHATLTKAHEMLVIQNNKNEEQIDHLKQEFQNTADRLREINKRRVELEIELNNEKEKTTYLGQ